MKKVLFGEKGGFPLEQETLIQLQDAYADDMLEALMGRWGADPSKSYWVSRPVVGRDGFIITPITRESDDDAEVTITKPELIRLVGANVISEAAKIVTPSEVEIPSIGLTARTSIATLESESENNNTLFTDQQIFYINIRDVRTDDAATLVYGDGASHKVYEEYIAEYTTEVTDLFVGDLETLPIDDLYLPRNGSKPMTGTLRAEQNVEIEGLLKLSNTGDSSSQVPLVLNPNGTVGKGVFPTPTVDGGEASFTPGMIMMWGGNIPPANWRLCDGGSPVNGITIPDLRSRFVVGFDPRTSSADSQFDNGYPMGSTGGDNYVTLTTSQMPSHSHSGTTGNSGNHTHNLRDTLYIEEGNHGNTVGVDGVEYLGSGSNNRNATTDRNGSSIHSHWQNETTNLAGLHSHTFTTNNIGGNLPHENRPPYYALAFIIYVGESNLSDNLPVISALNFVDDNNNAIEVLNAETSSFPVAFKTIANDLDGDILQYRYVITKPSGVILVRDFSTDNEYSNLLSSSFDENGTYIVTVSVSDGTNQVTTNRTISVAGNFVQPTDFINEADILGNTIFNTGPVLVNDSPLQHEDGRASSGAFQNLRALLLVDIENPPAFVWEFISGDSPLDTINASPGDNGLANIFLARGIVGTQRMIDVRCTVTYDNGEVFQDEITLIYTSTIPIGPIDPIEEDTDPDDGDVGLEGPVDLNTLF